MTYLLQIKLSYSKVLPMMIDYCLADNDTGMFCYTHDVLRPGSSPSHLPDTSELDVLKKPKIIVMHI